MNSYYHRYGYYPSIEYDLFCDKPFDVEHDVKEQISDKLYCGCTDGDSNEWYEISFEELKRRIISTDEKDLCSNNLRSKKHTTKVLNGKTQRHIQTEHESPYELSEAKLNHL